MEGCKIENETAAWREIIEAYFLPFIEFYFPYLYGCFTEHKYLDFEYRNFRECRGLLVKTEKTYFHVIVQNRREENYSERLFSWAVKTYAETGIFPATLLVLTDNDPGFNPDSFDIDKPGLYMRAGFNTAKLLYLKEQVEVYRLRGNPFSFVTEVQILVNALKCRRGSRRGKGNLYNRRSFEVLKKRLLHKLSREAFGSECSGKLRKFLDRIIDPPAA